MGTSNGVGELVAATLGDMYVDSALLQKQWKNDKLYMESVQGDAILGNMDLVKPLEAVSGSVVGKTGAMITSITPKDKKGKAARSIELVFLKALDMSVVQGRTTLLGAEDSFLLKKSTIFANDWKGGVAEETYGIDFRELDIYGVNDQDKTLLGQWLAEIRGMYLRQAFMTKISANITVAPVSETAGLTANWYFPGLTSAQQPAYDSTTADLENNIGIAADKVATEQDNVLTIPKLLKMIDYARETLYINQFDIAGKKMNILYLSTDDIRYLRDPSVTNSWGANWLNVGALQDVRKIVPAADIVIGDELIVVHDPRYVTCRISGAASDYNLAFGYMKQGRVSTRATAKTTGYYNVGIFAGPDCMACYEPEAPHYENQEDEYGKNKNLGLFGSLGYNAIIWDRDSGDATDATAQQEGFMNVLTSRLAIG
jgi:hypothetical protein